MRPKREHATNNGQTYIVTAATWERRALFRVDPWARLFIDTLYHYRPSAYALHAFVVMSDHVHLLITPTGSLEKAVQFIKGGFSYRVKKELGSNMEVWQKGFAGHRIRDAADFDQHVAYIRSNPVRKHLSELPEEYVYSSAHVGFALDDAPHGLKPRHLSGSCGAPKGAPFQNPSSDDAPVQNSSSAAPKGGSFQNSSSDDALKGTSSQNEIIKIA